MEYYDGMKAKVVLLLKNHLKLIFLALTILDSLLFFSFIEEVDAKNSELTTIAVIIEEPLLEKYSQYKSEKVTENLFSSMPLEKKVGQLFILSIPGVSLDPQSAELFNKYNIGGVAFLGSNISNADQLKAFTSEINETSVINPVIAVDQEGNTVHRISWDPTVGQEITFENMSERALLLSSLGINMNLAPVADVPFVENSFMASRALGNNVSIVSEYAENVILGHSKNNILTTVKHFPGHGRTTTDSHAELPIIDISKEELFLNDLVPFTALSKIAPAIMTAHLVFPRIDSEPTSSSKIFQTDILRGELEYTGLIIADDMNMGAVKNDPDRFIKAIKAGTNMIIYVQYVPEQSRVIDQLIAQAQTDPILESSINDSVKRILLTKCEYKILEECK